MAQYVIDGQTVEARAWDGSEQDGVRLTASRWGVSGIVGTASGEKMISPGDWIVSDSAGVRVISPAIFAIKAAAV